MSMLFTKAIKSAPPRVGTLGTVDVGLGAGVSVEEGVFVETGRITAAVVSVGTVTGNGDGI
jgi:hypothetical protein